jgi:hypothetical protein
VPASMREGVESLGRVLTLATTRSAVPATV